MRSGGSTTYLWGTGGIRRREQISGPRMTTLQDIRDDFALLDDWEDRFRYVIELGKALPAFPDSARTDANKVRGCASQVWLSTHIEKNGDGTPLLRFEGDSDAHLVRGLIAILFAIYNGRTAAEILGADAHKIFRELGLAEHLTPQRSNGFASMVNRVRADATAAEAAKAS